MATLFVINLLVFEMQNQTYTYFLSRLLILFMSELIELHFSVNIFILKDRV